MARRSRKTTSTETPDDGLVELVGGNGVHFTSPRSVASGLVRNGAAEYVDEADAEPAEQPEPPATAPTPSPAPEPAAE